MIKNVYYNGELVDLKLFKFYTDSLKQNTTNFIFKPKTGTLSIENRENLPADEYINLNAKRQEDENDCKYLTANITVPPNTNSKNTHTEQQDPYIIDNFNVLEQVSDKYSDNMIHHVCAMTSARYVQLAIPASVPSVKNYDSSTGKITISAEHMADNYYTPGMSDDENLVSENIFDDATIFGVHGSTLRSGNYSELSVTPTESAQTINPGDQKDGIIKLTLNAIGNEYSKPTGTKTVTYSESTSGEIDVTGYESLEVQIETQESAYISLSNTPESVPAGVFDGEDIGSISEDMIVTLHYPDDTTEDVTDDADVSALENSETFTVNYHGLTATFEAERTSEEFVSMTTTASKTQTTENNYSVDVTSPISFTSVVETSTNQTTGVSFSLEDAAELDSDPTEYFNTVQSGNTFTITPINNTSASFNVYATPEITGTKTFIGTINLSRLDNRIESISINENPVEINAGDTLTLTASITKTLDDFGDYLPDSDQIISWSAISGSDAISIDYSDDVYTAIITTDDDIQSDTTVTVKVEVSGMMVSGIEDTVTFTVKSLVVPVESITLSATTNEVDVGSEITVTATISPNNATNKSINWTLGSGESTYATLSYGSEGEHGTTAKITGVAAGIIHLTATAADGSGKFDQMTITVNNVAKYTEVLASSQPSDTSKPWYELGVDETDANIKTLTLHNTQSGIYVIKFGDAPLTASQWVSDYDATINSIVIPIIRLRPRSNEKVIPANETSEVTIPYRLYCIPYVICTFHGSKDGTSIIQENVPIFMDTTFVNNPYYTLPEDGSENYLKTKGATFKFNLNKPISISGGNIGEAMWIFGAANTLTDTKLTHSGNVSKAVYIPDVDDALQTAPISDYKIGTVTPSESVVKASIPINAINTLTILGHNIIFKNNSDIISTASSSGVSLNNLLFIVHTYSNTWDYNTGSLKDKQHVCFGIRDNWSSANLSNGYLSPVVMDGITDLISGSSGKCPYISNIVEDNKLIMPSTTNQTSDYREFYINIDEI